MNIAALSKWTFLVAGAYALFCVPAILIAERRGWSQGPWHVTQLVAAIVCFAGSVAFIASSKPRGLAWERSLAAIALILSGLWLTFVLYVFLTFDLSSMD